MTDNGPSKLEGIKRASRQLRGTIAEELLSDSDHFGGDDAQLLKFHGSYQQDDRDDRKDGKKYSLMLRSRVPGGKVTAEQFLAELDICDKWANGTLRVTDRQAFQLHGVLKTNLRDTIRGINEVKLSTVSACGDVCRNVMCCPAPHKNSPVYDQMQAKCDELADFVRPKSTAYYEIWLSDGENKEKVHEELVEEPLYGEVYLPRKFKMAFALPEDNCIDIYTQDLGFLAVVEDDTIVGYNVLAGGGSGMTPAKKDTFPAVGKRLTYVTPDQVLPVAEAIIKVQRDFGNRSDRKVARMKYLIANWGLEKFKAKVEEYYGSPLPEPHPSDVTDVDDHLGWHEQGDGKLFLGINIENGRIKDEGNLQLKAGFRALLTKYPVDTRLTALQSVILCDIDPAWKDDINSIMAAHGMIPAEELSLTRRYSIACPALPTCGLAVTESERVMPSVVDDIDRVLAEQGLTGERVSVHMTGCPNGCARPYTPDVGLVGKARNKYTMYLGGNAQGTRIAFLYQDMVPQEEIGNTLAPVFAMFKAQRNAGEAFGDFCHRVGKDAIDAAVS
ncbi:MAG: NADPH-dependent assimilatory sulfite reductase hemoprotein subunit [Planctomycetaceae bacterium]|nr:NADPH-dependent assimilatory sulfite reductase hemoprotein subunit [Planctomycetaceae bacterium]MCB9952210.1 NADPH-dependent assimilatory sulfite reductase hemoprotein subunit [Planctomycetaceae bacterium]